MYNEVLLKAISRYIDKKLDRPSGFNQDAEDTERVYVVKSSRSPSRPDWAESENPWLYGPTSRVLDIEDLVTLTSIEIDETRSGSYTRTLDATDYELLPRNAAVRPDPEPYKQIELTTWGTLGSWPPGVRVRVTGIHGWPSVPDGIKVVTVKLAAIVQMKDPLSTNVVQQLDQAVEASPQARAILMGLMTNYSAGVFF